MPGAESACRFVLVSPRLVGACTNVKTGIIQQRMDIYAYYGQMVAVHKLLSSEEQQDLASRERENVTGDGQGATSEWLGWEKHIGKRPEFPPVRESGKQPIPAKLRWAVWKRDNFTCKHRGCRILLRVDHTLPESKGGKLVMGNQQTLCARCNSRKGSKIPRSQKTPP